jgi:excisionase family DNA binding protein
MKRSLQAEIEGPEWLDLRALQQYACVSERMLREWIHRPTNPLQAVQVGSKILVRRSDFDRWLETHRIKLVDVSGIVEEILGGEWQQAHGRQDPQTRW